MGGLREEEGCQASVDWGRWSPESLLKNIRVTFHKYLNLDTGFLEGSSQLSRGRLRSRYLIGSGLK
jgi:hypothetical protein